MSKESRRRQRLAGQSTPSAAGPSSSTRRTAEAASRAGRPTATASTSPRGTDRTGRRERARPVAPASFAQRYRVLLIGAAVAVVAAVIGVGVFATATQAAYACSSVWQPDATPSAAAGASPQSGYVEPDMGQGHVPRGTKLTYTYCPPASGRHYNSPDAPITARVYGPGDGVIPQGWIHNLEHGALVVLYRGDQPDLDALRALFAAVPVSPVCGFTPGGQSPGPVVARFDDMAWPYAAVVWDRVLPLQAVDRQAVLDFYATWGERTNPEKLCTAPSAAPSTAPSGSVGPEPSTPASSGVPSPEASAANSPETSPAASAS
ncbi:MAG TPA: DUF3105 domain-containing protein [Candidatus Limnocylindrales bacterium]|nr:DUF3105 domain-containing protein [Candidatus Limnocylindrales bacterium]